MKGVGKEGLWVAARTGRRSLWAATLAAAVAARRVAVAAVLEKAAASGGDGSIGSSRGGRTLSRWINLG
jgi:hypothetical protein